MNRDEAKYILRSYDLNGRDAGDSQFQESLEMLRHDPELREWFAQEQAVDKKLSERFRVFPVPPDLKGRLLAARKVVPHRNSWRRPSLLSAAAASLALLGVLALLLSRTPEKRQFAEYRSYIVETAAKLDHLDIRTSDLAQIREWLGAHRAPQEFSIPGKLNGRSSVGCRVFAWNGQKVSLICFEIENKKVAHLFVIDSSLLTNPPAGGIPHFQTTGDGIATASWTDAQRIYILALEQGEQDLKRLLL
jgi:hypothetical protein